MSRSQTAVRSSTADVRRTSSTDQRQVWSLLRLASSPTDVACYLVYFSSLDIASAVTVRGRSGVLPKLQGIRKPVAFGEKSATIVIVCYSSGCLAYCLRDGADFLCFTRRHC